MSTTIPTATTPQGVSSASTSAPATPDVSGPTASRSVSILLSFTAGFVDTFGFVALFGLFTAHVTGNFVLIGAAIAGAGSAALLGKLLALPTFVVGVVATRTWQLRCEREGRASGVAVVVVQLLLLLAFMASGVLATPFLRSDGWPVVVVGLLGVLGMSVQNAASRSTFSKMSPSTVMTGNVTQICMDLVDLLTRAPGYAAAATRVRGMWPAITAFAIGSLGGGLAFKPLGFWSILAPVVALALVLHALTQTSPAP
ncbi:YoaK family protein [Polaromonas jejuensis]|uniref:YoaK family protein n=1 Tax=Polaromonas jejuensis TaxID=457502 RepID=A0ABW0QDJ6_9BURK|nr:YoaK family protein [Polaromonas jejuensis]